MKKIIFLSMVACLLAGSLFATPEPAEKILRLFHKEFPKIENPVFYDCGDSYMVFYKKNNSSSGRVYYNTKGETVRTLRYYCADELDPSIAAQVADEFKGRHIFGVTEIISGDDHSYHIVLEDAKHWYNVVWDGSGSIRTISRLKKA